MKVVQELVKSTFSDLAKLLDLELPSTWTTEDLAAMLRQQLRVNLCDEGLIPQGSLTLYSITFQDVLFADPPNLELLALCKQFGKMADRNAEAAIPGEIATVFYYAPIVVARFKCGKSLTTLTDAQVASALEWLLKCDWLIPEFYKLFSEAIGVFRSHPGPVESAHD